MLDERSGYFSAAAATIAQDGVAHISGRVISESLPPGAARVLAPYWSRLEVDAYLPGGATYRRRRFGRILATPETDGSYTLTILPHAPFKQSADTISLYEGRARWFAPIEPAALSSDPLHALIRLDLGLITAAEGRAGRFVVGIHMVRVVVMGARDAELPAPEGRHHDGHDYVAMHLVARDSCVGGASLVYRPGRDEPVIRTTLSNTLDTLVVDDRRVEHDVTPVLTLESCGTRDMLLVDFDPAGGDGTD